MIIIIQKNIISKQFSAGRGRKGSPDPPGRYQAFNLESPIFTLLYFTLTYIGAADFLRFLLPLDKGRLGGV
ncbi:MAG: hypothetical protein WA063_03425 [Minisyncoccia bacterium]